MWTIEQATVADAHRIALHMTPADAAEVWAIGHWTPLQALLRSISLSVRARTWFVDGEPVCIGGFAVPSLLGDTANPWMLGTPALRASKYAFLRNYRTQIDYMLAHYPVLETWVDARHNVCLRWLKWTGFDIYEPVPYGVDGLPFRKVEIVRA